MPDKREKVEQAIRTRIKELDVTVVEAKIGPAVDAIIKNPTTSGIAEAIVKYLPNLSVINESVDSTDTNYWIQRIRDIVNEKK